MRPRGRARKLKAESVLERAEGRRWQPVVAALL